MLTYAAGWTVSNRVSPRERLRRSTTGAAVSVRTVRVVSGDVRDGDADGMPVRNRDFVGRGGRP
ncbi:hypothetical protein DF047_03200 [Burkholderia cenocepacia]|nr:hypothetical protein DF047_03200 [Burkholderia cenocepacia]